VQRYQTARLQAKSPSRPITRDSLASVIAIDEHEVDLASFEDSTSGQMP
jgi:hypothetical protein